MEGTLDKYMNIIIKPDEKTQEINKDIRKKEKSDKKEVYRQGT